MLDRRLELFIMAAESGSITDTANKLYVSQPAVSKQISSLEKELNVKLFHRDKHSGLVLTDVGKRIFLLAKQASYIDNSIYQAAFQENDLIQGSLKIASLPILSTALLTKALPMYRRKYPNVSVQIIEGSRHELKTMVLEHSADIALTCSPFEELDSDMILRNKIIAVLPDQTSDLPKYTDLASFKSSELIICGCVREALAEKYKSAFNSALYFEHPETVVRMVRNNAGIGLIPEFTLGMISAKALTRPIKPELYIDIGAAAVSLRSLTPAAGMFYKIIKETAAEL